MEIAYICIYASNLEESVIFYRDILGLEEDLVGSDKSFHALKAGVNNIGIERNGMRKDGQKTNAENAILLQFKANSMEELEKITKRLETKGANIIDRLVQKSYATITNLLDPDGNKVEIIYESTDQ